MPAVQKNNVDLLSWPDKGFFRGAVEYAVSVKADGGGYYVTVAIPWTDVVTPVGDAITIGFDVQLSDRLNGASERDAYKG